MDNNLSNKNDLDDTKNTNNITKDNVNLKVISIDEKSYLFLVDTNINVKTLKTLLEEKSNVPWDKQRLIHKGKLLENSKQLKFYNIKDMDAVHLIAKINSENNDNLNNNNVIEQTDNTAFRDNRRFRLFDTRANNNDNINIIDSFPFNLFTFSNRRNTRDNVNNSNITDNMFTCIIQNNLQIQEFLLNDNIRKNLKYIKLNNINNHNTEDYMTSFLRPDNIAENNNNFNNDYKIKFVDYQNRNFTVGQWIDVKDTVDHWLEAEIIDIKREYTNNNKHEKYINNSLSMIKIHYIGWDDSWDEWLSFDSKRVLPFRYYTSDKFKDRSCPTTKNINTSPVNIDGLCKFTNENIIEIYKKNLLDEESNNYNNITNQLNMNNTSSCNIEMNNINKSGFYSKKINNLKYENNDVRNSSLSISSILEDIGKNS